MRRAAIGVGVLWALACGGPPPGGASPPSGDVQAATAPPVAPVVPRSAWHMHTERSPMDDSVSVAAGNDSTDVWNDRFGRQHGAQMVLRCEHNKTELFIDFGASLEIEDLDSVRLALRFDSDKATKQWAGRATNYTGAFLRDPIDTAKAMTKHATLAVAFTPSGLGETYVHFDLVGADEAVKQVREACHW